MTHFLKKFLLVSIASATATCVIAQTPPAETDETAPQAASSPHQRETTSTSAAEAPANAETQPSSSATPHQRQATETADAKASQKDQMLNDCISKQQKADSKVTKDQAKRTCTDQMKKSEAPAG